MQNAQYWNIVLFGFISLKKIVVFRNDNVWFKLHETQHESGQFK